MSNQEKVIAKIDKKTGKMVIEAQGFVGDSCHCIDEVEQQLGMITKTEDTNEKYNYVQPDYLPNQLA